MKVKHTIHIHQSQYAWEKSPEFIVYTHKFEDAETRTYVCSQEIELEIPDNFDPRARQIAALENEKKRVMAEYQKTITSIAVRLSKLQAITYEEGAG